MVTKHHARRLAAVLQHHPTTLGLTDLGDAAAETARLAGMRVNRRNRPETDAPLTAVDTKSSSDQK